MYVFDSQFVKNNDIVNYKLWKYDNVFLTWLEFSDLKISCALLKEGCLNSEKYLL